MAPKKSSKNLPDLSELSAAELQKLLDEKKKTEAARAAVSDDAMEVVEVEGPTARSSRSTREAKRNRVVTSEEESEDEVAGTIAPDRSRSAKNVSAPATPAVPLRAYPCAWCIDHNLRCLEGNTAARCASCYQAHRKCMAPEPPKKTTAPPSVAPSRSGGSSYASSIAAPGVGPSRSSSGSRAAATFQERMAQATTPATWNQDFGSRAVATYNPGAVSPTSPTTRVVRAFDRMTEKFGELSTGLQQSRKEQARLALEDMKLRRTIAQAEFEQREEHMERTTKMMGRQLDAIKRMGQRFGAAQDETASKAGRGRGRTKEKEREMGRGSEE